MEGRHLLARPRLGDSRLRGRSGRAGAAALAGGAVAGGALVALVDPNEPGHYPGCPTQTLLGLDCPACGVLRGVHALARGDVVGALDHNLLLLAAVPVALLCWWGWIRVAVGRPGPPTRWPTWAPLVAVVLAAAFAVARNLPVGDLAWLGSAAS